MNVIVFHLGMKVSWILTNIAYPTAFVITTIYWAILFKGLAGIELYNSINCHAAQVTPSNSFPTIFGYI